MARISRTKRLLSVALLALVLCGSFITAVSSVAQQGTEVGAILCQTESPDLQITEPLSDSVTDLPIVQIEGTALYTSQIDVIINGQYSHSVAIGFDSVLQTQVSLEEGTNTITMQAYFSCNGTSAEVDIIIDYQPAVIPTSPGNIDTAVISSESGTSVRSQDGGLSSFTTQVTDAIKEKLGQKQVSDDPDFTVNRSYVSTAFNWAMLLAILVLLGVLFAPGSVIEKLVNLLGLNRRSIQYRRRFVRFVLIFLIILFATIFSFS